MSEKSELKKFYCCKLCNKYYSSNSSLCNHNKKFHNNNNLHYTSKYLKIPQKYLKIPQNTSIINCKYCNKILSRYNNLIRHEKICKNKNNNIDTNIEIIKLNQIK